MTEITALLVQVANGNKASLDNIFAQLHAELKAVARNRISGGPSQTMTATALVHELYLKLIDAHNLDLVSRQHFFACAGSAMRQILVDSARASSAEKRGGELVFVTLNDTQPAHTNSELLALDEAMQDLQRIQPELLELVHLRFFAGLSMQAIAELTNRSERSLHRDWACARAFLTARVSA